MKRIQPAHKLCGELSVPGDKSISHRGIMFGAISSGTTRLTNFLTSADCRSTIACFSSMGIQIELEGTSVLIHGNGLNGLLAPTDVLYTGNSGTTTRLLTGLLAGQSFSSVLDGDSSIRKRPMRRVMIPLQKMGATIEAVDNDHCPLSIHGTPLHGTEYTLPVASAQLKSAIILAAMYADSETVIHEPVRSRDHTERMLTQFGGAITRKGDAIIVPPQEKLYAQEITVPGDISSAAFLLVAGCIVSNSELTLKSVGINETRTGILDVLNAMGADIRLENITDSAEPCADLVVRSSSLHGCEISGDLIPRLIDELPVIAVAAAYAEGTTVIKEATELKFKESNRIRTIVDELSKAGVDIVETDDGMIINGGVVSGAEFDAHDDHRIAMAMAVCALGATSASVITGESSVDISYPTFFDDLSRIVEEA